MIIDYLKELEQHINSIKELTRECDAQNIDIEQLRSKVAALEQSIVEMSIPDGSVTSAKLATNAVTSGKIANNAVTSAKIANNAVTSAKIAAGAVQTTNLADRAVTTDKLIDGAVTNDKLALDYTVIESASVSHTVLSQDYQDIGEHHIVPAGLYLWTLYTRAGTNNTVTTPYSCSTRVTSNGTASLARILEQRFLADSNPATCVHTGCFRLTQETTLWLQARTYNGVTNSDYRAFLHAVRLGD